MARCQSASAEGDGIAHDGAADVVVQNVDAAAAIEGEAHGACKVGGNGGVRDDGVAAPAFADNGGARFLDRLTVDIHGDHMRAFASKQDGRRLAVAPARSRAAGADHQRRLVAETAHDPLSLLPMARVAAPPA